MTEQTQKDESLDKKVKSKDELVAITVRVGHKEVFLGYEKKDKEYKK